jgi:hypothetical protein
MFCQENRTSLIVIVVTNQTLRSVSAVIVAANLTLHNVSIVTVAANLTLHNVSIVRLDWLHPDVLLIQFIELNTNGFPSSTSIILFVNILKYSKGDMFRLLY